VSIFDLFSRKSKHENVKIEFAKYSRNEEIIYRKDDKEISLSYTYVKGSRIFPDDIKKWKDGTLLTDSDKEKIFVGVLNFVRKISRTSTIVVINTDDPDKDKWNSLCSINLSKNEKIEYTSDAEVFQSLKNLFIGSLKSSGKAFIDDIEITNEQDLDAALENYKKKRDN
jgi:hypothetical protein